MKEAVLCFSFGKPIVDVKQNRANIIIARRGLELSQLLGVNLFCDASCVPLWQKNVITIGNESAEIHKSTAELAEEALRIFKERGIKKVWFITASPYLSRALYDVRTVFKDADIEVTGVDLDGECFFSDSVQPWTTSAWRWWRREIVLLFLQRVSFRFYAWLTKKLA